MFKRPDAERLDAIMDMIPEMVSVLCAEGKGYNVRIAQMGELSRMRGIAKELGINISLFQKFSIDGIVSLLNENNVPDFAVVKKDFGDYTRYRLSFGDNEDPIIDLHRDFWKMCIEGQIYIYQQVEVSKRQQKRMKASGALSYFHINKNQLVVL